LGLSSSKIAGFISEKQKDQLSAGVHFNSRGKRTEFFGLLSIVTLFALLPCLLVLHSTHFQTGNKKTGRMPVLDNLLDE
jgi:hypothetical protein